jgi:hypothetical protein
MRQTHRAGEKLFVDYTGQTVPVITPARKRKAKDKHEVQAHALEHKVKFVRIVRRKIKSKKKYAGFSGV